MEYLELISVPAIVIVVYFIIEIIKKCVGNNEKFKRFIPLIATAIGAICGVVCFFALPSIIPASNVVTATGTNQIIKQLGKKDGGDENKSD